MRLMLETRAGAQAQPDERAFRQPGAGGLGAPGLGQHILSVRRI
jgi:hypothetical protein